MLAKEDRDAIYNFYTGDTTPTELLNLGLKAMVLPVDFTAQNEERRRLPVEARRDMAMTGVGSTWRGESRRILSVQTIGAAPAPTLTSTFIPTP